MENDFVNVVICLNIRDATNMAFKFWSDNKSDVLKAESTYPFLIHLNDGSRYIFMVDTTYNKWCKGRTYFLNGVLCHSGYMLERGN